MPVPTSISDLTNIAATNSPAGTESVKGTIDDYLRAHGAFIRQLSDIVSGPTVTLASASNVAIGFASSGNITITGTASIFGFDNVAEGTMRWVTFTGSLLLVHNSASLFLPGAVNVQTNAGDAALFKSAGGGNWRCMVYQRISGTGATQATTAQDGYLTASDWNKFNGKQNAGESVLLSGGGTVTGSIGIKGGGLSLGDAGGTLRQFLFVGGDNWTNMVNVGGTGIRVFSQDGSAVLLTLDNSGNISPLGAVTLKNGSALRAYDTGGAIKNVVFLAPDNWLNYYGGATGTRWWNSASTAVIATLSDAGGISANTVTETSDERKKKAWQRLPADFIDKLASIRKAGLFTWKRGGARGLGVGAQSLERILPAAVHTDEQGAKTVQYGAAAMVSVVELARAMVDVRNRLAALEAK